VDRDGEFAVTCTTVYVLVAATVAVGVWGELIIYDRLRFCPCPFPHFEWDTFTKFFNKDPDSSFDRNRANRAERKSNRNIDPKPGKKLPPIINLDNFKTKTGRWLDFAADILSKIFNIK